MSKGLSTQPYKGTRDFYPEDMKLRNWFFSKMKEVCESYCYGEYNGPTLEAFDIYAAKSGEEIVNEQTYNFYDKGERRLAVRPEMTPTVARMVASKLEQLTFPVRWYSIPNCMRYEAPQRGRMREFWQLNVDLFGENDMKADLEIMSIVVDMMKSFGADASKFKVKINNRKFFNEVLTDVIKVSPDKTVAVSKAIDKRAKISKEEFEKWLRELEISKEGIEILQKIFTLSFEEVMDLIKIDTTGAKEIKELFGYLKDAGLNQYCEFDFSVIRGFDYYTGTVFEVYDTHPDNRRAMFGGGRYDDLVGIFKENSNVSGIGFGLGDVTLQDFLESHNLIPENLKQTKNVLITVFEDVNYNEYVKISKTLRDNNISNSIYLGSNKKFKKQLGYAEKNKYPITIVMGQSELEENKLVIKHMDLRQEFVVTKDEYVEKIKELLK